MGNSKAIHMRIPDYLTDENPPPQGPYRRPMPRVLGGYQGVGLPYERGDPVLQLKGRYLLTSFVDFLLVHTY